MSIESYIERLTQISNYAKELADLTETTVDIEEDGGMFTINIRKRESGTWRCLYRKTAETAEDIDKHVQGLLIGAMLAKGIEI